jgi:diguanylate cyclase (GGDEF)-like protein/PAS domain S-box-containing protein
MRWLTSAPTSLGDALIRLADAEETLRAIAAGEVDAFVVSDGTGGQRVFTLTTADRPYRMFVENMRDGAATLSSGGVILYANRRLADLLATSREAIVGRPLATFLASSRIGVNELRISDVLGTTFELDLLDATGTVVPVQVGSSPLEVDGDALTCLTFTDLTEQKAKDREIARLGQAQAGRMADLQHAQAALTRQATHDALTGLPNRTLLIDRIDLSLAQCERSGRCTAVLFVDLDRFKQINDMHGHLAGDALLRRVATRLVATLRPMDSVARIGGDEFAILAPDIASQLAAVDLGARIVDGLYAHSEHVDAHDAIPASVGITVSVGGRGTAETLLGEADSAMYQAKSRGGGRIAVFDAELGRLVSQRSVARRLIRAALEDRRVIAHYQPIIAVSSGAVIGFEALARIAARDGTILSPAAFIPAAEESRLVVPLGTDILETACREARRWPLAGMPERPLMVAVNLSRRQFEAGDFSALVRSCLDDTGLDPARLLLELTETTLLDVSPEMLDQLVRLRDVGVQVGLDDFGTGYASLTHLSRLPLSFVKIAPTFVHGLGTASEDERIVSAVVNLAQSLGLRSIAEGVETDDQFARLRDLGCDEAQGYLFAAPLAAADIPVVLERSARRTRPASRDAGSRP